MPLQNPPEDSSGLTRLDPVTSIMKALANSARLRVVEIVHEAGEISVNNLQEKIGHLSQSALSQHLAVLRSNNIVRTRRESQTIYYTLKDDLAVEIINLVKSRI